MPNDTTDQLDLFGGSTPTATRPAPGTCAVCSSPDHATIRCPHGTAPSLLDHCGDELDTDRTPREPAGEAPSPWRDRDHATTRPCDLVYPPATGADAAERCERCDTPKNDHKYPTTPPTVTQPATWHCSTCDQDHPTSAPASWRTRDRYVWMTCPTTGQPASGPLRLGSSLLDTDNDEPDRPDPAAVRDMFRGFGWPVTD